MKFTGNSLSKKGFSISKITKRIPYVEYLVVMFRSDFVKARNLQNKFGRNICQVTMGYRWLGCLRFL